MSVCGNLAHSSKYILVKTLSENCPARRHLSCHPKALFPSPHESQNHVLATSGRVQAKSMELKIRVTSLRAVIYWLCNLGEITF